MERKTPLQRKPWRKPDAPPRREAKQTTSIARAKEPAKAAAELPMAKPAPKENKCVSEAYRRAVATLACYRCRIEGRTQVCHTDLGKGGAYKTDDRGVWPGCADGPGFEGCHTWVGRHMTRDQRREFEARAARDTRATVRAMGLWPKSLPHLEQDEEATA